MVLSHRYSRTVTAARRVLPSRMVTSQRPVEATPSMPGQVGSGVRYPLALAMVAGLTKQTFLQLPPAPVVRRDIPNGSGSVPDHPQASEETPHEPADGATRRARTGSTVPQGRPLGRSRCEARLRRPRYLPPPPPPRARHGHGFGARTDGRSVRRLRSGGREDLRGGAAGIQARLPATARNSGSRRETIARQSSAAMWQSSQLLRSYASSRKPGG